jgi:hypothetical protein
MNPRSSGRHHPLGLRQSEPRADFTALGIRSTSYLVPEMRTQFELISATCPPFLTYTSSTSFHCSLTNPFRPTNSITDGTRSHSPKDIMLQKHSLHIMTKCPFHKFIRQPSTNLKSKTSHYTTASASAAAPATASPGFTRPASLLPPAPAEMTATTPFVVTWPAAAVVLGMMYTTVPDVTVVYCCCSVVTKGV